MTEWTTKRMFFGTLVYFLLWGHANAQTYYKPTFLARYSGMISTGSFSDDITTDKYNRIVYQFNQNTNSGVKLSFDVTVSGDVRVDVFVTAGYGNQDNYADGYYGVQNMTSASDSNLIVITRDRPIYLVARVASGNGSISVSGSYTFYRYCKSGLYRPSSNTCPGATQVNSFGALVVLLVVVIIPVGIIMWIRRRRQQQALQMEQELYLQTQGYNNAQYNNNYPAQPPPQNGYYSQPPPQGTYPEGWAGNQPSAPPYNPYPQQTPASYPPQQTTGYPAGYPVPVAVPPPAGYPGGAVQRF